MDEAKRESRDVIVVGAGPIGIELAAELERAGARVLVLDRGPLGATITRWPANTHFFSAPERVSIAGIPAHSPNQRPLTGDQYLAYLRTVVESLGLDLRLWEEVAAVQREGEGFLVRTARKGRERVYEARQVVLAVGDMTRSRRLGLPGEEQEHVLHVLPDPHLLFRQRLLVVGGKNSALEGALRAYRAGAAEVAISYRHAAFDGSVVKPFLKPEIEMLIAKRQIGFHPGTVPTSIGAEEVELAAVRGGEKTTVPADFVLLAVGYEGDLELLRASGVELEGERGLPRHDHETMETNVPGLYVAGTVAGGDQQRYDLFIETTHQHVDRIVRAVTGRSCARTGSGYVRNYPFSLGDVQGRAR